MAKRISICLAVAFATVFTHGMVYSSANLDSSKLMPSSTYQGLFAHVVMAIWSVWAHVHGFQPISHINDFGRFYARLVVLGCPLAGFGIFLLGSRQKIGGQLWKPLAIAIVFTPLGELISGGFRAIGLTSPVAEAGRAAVVLLLMIWSVGAIRISRWRHSAMEGFPLEMHST